VAASGRRWHPRLMNATTIRRPSPGVSRTAFTASRRVTRKPCHETLTASREHLTASREVPTPRHEALATRFKTLIPCHEVLMPRCEPAMAGREALTLRRGLRTAHREVPTRRRESPTAHRETLTPCHELPAACSEARTVPRDLLTPFCGALTASGESLTTRREVPTACSNPLTGSCETLAACLQAPAAQGKSLTTSEKGRRSRCKPLVASRALSAESWITPVPLHENGAGQFVTVLEFPQTWVLFSVTLKACLVNKSAPREAPAVISGIPALGSPTRLVPERAFQLCFRCLAVAFVTLPPCHDAIAGGLKHLPSSRRGLPALVHPFSIPGGPG